jgi:hypothetical protein
MAVNHALLPLYRLERGSQPGLKARLRRHSRPARPAVPAGTRYSKAEHE